MTEPYKCFWIIFSACIEFRVLSFISRPYLRAFHSNRHLYRADVLCKWSWHNDRHAVYPTSSELKSRTIFYPAQYFSPALQKVLLLLLWMVERWS